MACLGLPDIRRIARSGVAEVPGAAEHLADCVGCAAALGSFVRENRGSDTDVEQLGRYQVLSERGRGAFGRVFEAFDPALDRRVAIKLISFSTPSSPAALAELLREAKAMAQIQHPNVIPIFDVGRTDDGVFLTMPIVDGETLAAWAQRQRATGVDPEIMIARFAGKVAAGLAAIHAAGFVHRDIKPSNVLVAGTSAWIADLGLARRTPRNTTIAGGTFADGALTASTHTESLGGTPAYMAPECLVGGAASPRSDQYALAVTVVEILTGHRPFEAPTYLGLLAAARSEAPRLDGVPPRFHAALARALHPTPDQRFPSVAAFATALLERPRARRARYAIVAVLPVLAIVGWKWVGSSEPRTPVVRLPVTITPIQLPAPMIDAAVAPDPPAPSHSRAPCTGRCAADHERAAARCNQTEPSCRATSVAAFAACGDALDTTSCERLRSQFVQACTQHEVTIDRTCGERARGCGATCTAIETTCEAAIAAPVSEESCHATLLACQATAAAKVTPLEETRRRSWGDCATANTTCRASTTGTSCAETLRHCNTTVAARFEHDKELVDHEDHGCLVSHNECFAGSSGASRAEACQKAAGACTASCTRTQYECLAKPAPSTDCSTAADAAFASCQRTCKP